jgi:16S rRNA (cytidine1402-2'-O)-methyltransferase
VTGTLFVVGTPIGNLDDLTDRARRTLAAVDLIAAEDTRRTGKLLAADGIERTRLVSLFDANERSRMPRLLRMLRDGKDVALVSDGGMPLVSDPGYALVRAAAAEGVDVRVVPGPSAAVAALVVSGLPTDRWAFEGFVPKKQAERRRRLESIREDRRTLIFFESPARIHGLLGDMLDVFGDRPVAVCRELTKLHEEVLRGPLSEVLGELREDVKGEVVVVVGGDRTARGPDVDAIVDEAVELVDDGMKKREAARTVAERHDVSANALYRALLDVQETDATDATGATDATDATAGILTPRHRPPRPGSP